MTEDQIERRAEAMQDSTDRAYLTGGLSQAEYDAKCARIAAWVTEQHALRRGAIPA